MSLNVSVKLPHVILLMTDQHRGDAVGCAGNAVIKTPNIDSLAAEGACFPNAVSSTPSCTPARAALLTGLAPWNHGMLGYGRGAPGYPYEMPRMMRDAGYSTHGIGKMHWHPQRALHGFHGVLLDESGRSESPGFVSDYRQWFHETAPGKDPDATGIGWNANTWGDYVHDETLHPTAWTGETAAAKIESHDAASPLFLKVSFARPHSPYDAPARLAEMYDWEDMPAPVVGDWTGGFSKKRGLPSPWYGDFGVEHAQRARRHYYASITFIDEQVGKIIAALERKGMLDDSLILFTSDHGDMLGDHHHWRKTYAYRGSSGIPMVLRWPTSGVLDIDAKRGLVLPNVVELRDVLPTFLDAAGVDRPAGMDGMSLLGPVRDRDSPWRGYVDMEHSRCYDLKNYWLALFDGKTKYIFNRATGREQLFDVESDPGECHDISSTDAGSPFLEEWRAKMARHLKQRGKEWVRDGRPRKSRRSMLYSPNFPSHRA